jgi:leucyl/phenylalanyl-tRNA---protein transferase
MTPDLSPDLASPSALELAQAQRARRGELFRESPLQWAKRATFGLLRALQPARIAQVPFNTWLWLVSLIEPGALPDPEAAPMVFEGVCGIARDLSVATLMRAHSRGLHPSSHVGPIKWWSPPERCVLFFDEFHISSRLKRQMRQGRYTVTFDRDFEATIAACAEPRDGKWPVTWITPKLMHAYAALYDAGFAHSFEVWNEAGVLAGGGYGVAAGGVFIIESQFSREPNTSKMGLTSLIHHLSSWGFAMADGKGPTPTILDMGFRVIPRADYLARLAVVGQTPVRPGRWQVEADLKTVAAWEPGPAPAKKSATAV